MSGGHIKSAVRRAAMRAALRPTADQVGDLAQYTTSMSFSTMWVAGGWQSFDSPPCSVQQLIKMEDLLWAATEEIKKKDGGPAAPEAPSHLYS